MTIDTFEASGGTGGGGIPWVGGGGGTRSADAYIYIYMWIAVDQNWFCPGDPHSLRLAPLSRLAVACSCREGFVHVCPTKKPFSQIGLSQAGLQANVAEGPTEPVINPVFSFDYKRY